ncbi:hypothetical protein C8A05DRAFT_48187 [Staphylotrichum tortipilum]|uniref:NYN domain-containing protein n=1 Tax=Staphylotrichum tortipilum TaxID=2831512 RepID=A0AAN6MBJ4_9PEZI|nr:hypothetical protein C8A05DRAFT_48187 [Staphylotrichum longicolle]
MAVGRPIFGHAATQLKPVTPKEQQPQRQTGKVFVYIDNSNLWIQGQRTYAEKNKLNTSWDPRWRFDAGKVKNVLLSGSGLSADEETFDYEISLYGSTPPPVDTVWKAIQAHNIKVRTHPRSSWTRREKEIDSDIIADSVSNATAASFNGTRAVFIIVSGDRDLRPAMIKITQMGFHAHLWSWSNGLAKIFTLPDDEIEKSLFHVHDLDPYLKEVGFTQTTFRVTRAAMHPQSFVILDPIPKADLIEQFIATLKIPSFRYELKVQRAGASSRDLVVIPAFAKSMKSDDLRRLFLESQARLKRIGIEALILADYRQQYPPHNVEEEEEVVTSNRFLEYNNNNNNNKAARHDGEDFGADGSDNDDDDDEEEEEEDDEGEGEKKDDNDGFVDVLGSYDKRTRRLQKAESSLQWPCHWRGYCPYMSACKHGHTKEEEEHFKVYGPREVTKYKYCNNNDCHRQEKDCRFAHDKTALFCPTCEMKGDHPMSECPKGKGRNRKEALYRRPDEF